mmetsp:Transcript_54194/g.107642  ORF Transcript_54194/g.107642 Transcript_54194/m.107642 type:complete len:99 (+) Transcript_54194:4-300(+)
MSLLSTKALSRALQSRSSQLKFGLRGPGQLSLLTCRRYVSMLLFLIYYIYAIVGCILFASNDPWHFRDVLNAMLTLFRASTFEDWTDIMTINMYGCDK